jgi:hypothetical protein
VEIYTIGFTQTMAEYLFQRLTIMASSDTGARSSTTSWNGLASHTSPIYA